MTPHDSPIRTVCAHTPAPRRRPSRPDARTTSRPAESATRLADARYWWAFATLTKSAGAREHYDKRRAAGDHHNAALRNLANTLLGRLWWCLANNQPWDDDAAWPQRDQYPNPVAA